VGGVSSNRSLVRERRRAARADAANSGCFEEDAMTRGNLPFVLLAGAPRKPEARLGIESSLSSGRRSWEKKVEATMIN